MIDQKTLSYINMYAVLGALENLCELDDKAKAILENKPPISIGFFIKNGAKAVFTFTNGKCKMTPNKAECDIKLPFLTPEKFNGMINGTSKPIPVKGFSKLGFLLHEFVDLTNRLNELMRPSEEALNDKKFKTLSTKLMTYTIGGAISQIANHDTIGNFSANNTSDGCIAIEIINGPAITVKVKDHIFTTIKNKCFKPDGKLEFCSLELARDVFDDKVNTMSCICDGQILMTGMIGNIDNVNRILDRVPLYLR